MLDVLSRNIIFIGFMGSGKSTVGQAIAKRLKRICFDTDSIIEDSEGKKIVDIFKENGEEYFRDREIDIADHFYRFIKVCVLSTGGGLPTVVENMQGLGIIFFLDIDFDFMMSRMTQDDIKQRPLLQDLEKARKLFHTRREIYKKQSHFTIKITGQDMPEIVSEIIDNIHIAVSTL